MSHYSLKAIVIGSGIAGMAAAIRLAVQGFEVKVFEANDSPGGKLTSFERNGFLFDAGPSLFTQPENIEELFAYANEPIASYFQYSKVDISCKYFFENRKIITAYGDKEKLTEEFVDKLGEEPLSVKNYLKNSEKLYHNIGSIFLNYSLHHLFTTCLSLAFSSYIVPSVISPPYTPIFIYKKFKVFYKNVS